MVIAAGCDECRLPAVALFELKAQHAAIEGERTIEIGDLEMHVSDAVPGWTGRAVSRGSMLASEDVRVMGPPGDERKRLNFGSLCSAGALNVSWDQVTCRKQSDDPQIDLVLEVRGPTDVGWILVAADLVPGPTIEAAVLRGGQEIRPQVSADGRARCPRGLGAAWGEEEDRPRSPCSIPTAIPCVRNHATGLRNCSGMAMQPRHRYLW
jgi:hypothetical protein